MSTEPRLALTPDDLAAALEVRRVVFIEGQGVAHDIERDGLDSDATHVIVEADGRVIATGRFVAQQDAGGVARVGRMAVLEAHRGRGIATAVLAALESEARRQGLGRAELHAQAYIQGLYGRRGYSTVGEPYIEAGIDHITMVKHL